MEARITANPTKQCDRNLSPPEVSPETGTSADVAGDFREVLAIVANFWSLETNRERAKTPQMQAFRAQIDRNLRSSDWLAGAGGIEPPNGGIKIRCLAARFPRAPLSHGKIKVLWTFSQASLKGADRRLRHSLAP
jgi:hypothetical protein